MSSSVQKKNVGGCYGNCSVSSLIKWDDQKKSGIVFASGIVALYLLKTYTLLGLLSYVLLYSTSLCTSWVLVKNIITAIQQSQNQQAQVTHPFQQFLDKVPVAISDDQARKIASILCKSINQSVNYVVDLVLAKSSSQSAAFALCLYLCSGIFASYEFLSLAMFFWVCIFTLPKVYQLKKTEIDNLLNKAWEPVEPHYTKVVGMVQKFKNANKNLKNVDEKGE